MRILRTGWVLLILAALLVSVGCSGGTSTKAPEKTAPKKTDTAPSTTTPTTPAKQNVAVKLAPGPIGGLLYVSEMAAEGIGAFKDQGIDLTVLPTPGGNEAAKALMAGEADFAMLAFDHVIKNRAQGADLVVVMFLTKEPGLVMIAQADQKDTVKSIKDLKGQKVGVSSLGGGTHMAVLSLMKQAGMKETDIEIVAAKDKLAEMWNSKQIAAAMHVDPQITELVASNKAFVLYDLRKAKDTNALYGTDYPLGTLVTRQDVIQNKPDLVQKMVSAVITANKYIQTHSPAEITAKIPATYKGDSKAYEQMVGQNVEGLAMTGMVSEESMNTVLRELKANKAIPADSNVTVANSINMSFVSKVK